MIPGSSDGKASAYSAEDPGSIPGFGRSAGEGNGNPLQYSCLENPMDRRVCRLQSTGSQRIGHDWATSLTHSLPSVYLFWTVHDNFWRGRQYCRKLKLEGPRRWSRLWFSSCGSQQGRVGKVKPGGLFCNIGFYGIHNSATTNQKFAKQINK